MASHLSYVTFVCEQMAGAGVITWRRMFGEFGLYRGGKFFGVICDDQTFLKITPAGVALAPDCPRGVPYQGGSEMLMPDVEDREALTALVRVTCDALPEKRKRR